MGPGVVIPGLWSTGSIVVSVGFSCSAARGIFLAQGSNPCLLHWQADSYPLDQQGSSEDRVLTEEDLSLLRTLGRFCWNMFEKDDRW